MNTKKAKNRFKKGMLLLGLSLLLTNCEREETTVPTAQIDSIEDVNPEKTISSAYVSADEIPHIMDLLGGEKDKTSKSAYASTPLGKVELENILQVVDSLGNENYSFQLFPEVERPGSFFNVVINAGGDGAAAAILEYRMDKDFARGFYAGTRDFSQFTGTLFTYPFSGHGSLFGKDTCVQNFDEIVICSETIINGGNGDNGGGGGTENPLDPVDGGGGGTGAGPGYVVDVYWVCDHRGRRHDAPDHCTDPNGPGSGTWVIEIRPLPDPHTNKGSSLTKRDLNCCDDAYVEGTVGVNLMATALSDIMNCIGLLSTHEMTVMSGTLATMRLKMFLNANGCSPEARAFGISAKDAIVRGGEVDFVNMIIKDSTFVDTKADCVLNKLLNQTSYFKNVMDAFTNNNSEYKIKFQVKPVTQHGADAETTGPDGNNIVTITISPSAAQADALYIAQNLLHEGAHAQLRRIIASGNRGKYNLSTEEYDWLIELQDWWQDYSNNPLPTAAHDFMSVKYVTPIANVVRNFDDMRYPLANYMYFGWEGLFDEGQNRGLITRSQFDSYFNLAEIPLTDNHKTSCD